MAEYYSKEQLLECAKTAFQYDLYEIEDFLEEVPTADVVEVVRCKKCKYYETINLNGTNISSCNNSLLGLTHVKSDAYCSYGERGEE